MTCYVRWTNSQTELMDMRTVHFRLHNNWFPGMSVCVVLCTNSLGNAQFPTFYRTAKSFHLPYSAACQFRYKQQYHISV